MVSICGPSIMNSPRSGGGSALYRDYDQNQTGAGRSLKSAKMISDSGIESGSSPELISNNNNDEAPMSRTAQYRKVGHNISMDMFSPPIEGKQILIGSSKIWSMFVFNKTYIF